MPPKGNKAGSGTKVSSTSKAIDDFIGQSELPPGQEQTELAMNL